MSVFRTITEFGVSFSRTRSERRNIVLTNLISLTAAAVPTCILLGRLFFYDQSFGGSSRLLLGSLFLLLPIFMNRMGFVNASRVVLCWIPFIYLFGGQVVGIRESEAYQASGYLGAGAIPGIMGNRHPSIAPYQTFPTADRPIALAVGNDKQFKLLADALNLPLLADDSRFASNPQRVHNRDVLAETLGAVLKTRGADYWYETLTAVGVPAGPINNVAEAFTFAEQLGLDVSVSVPASATPQVANPISLSQTPVSYRSAPPSLGDATPRE